MVAVDKDKRNWDIGVTIAESPKKREISSLFPSRRRQPRPAMAAVLFFHVSVVYPARS
jgi:hypothetical protein